MRRARCRASCGSRLLRRMRRVHSAIAPEILARRSNGQRGAIGDGTLAPISMPKTGGGRARRSVPRSIHKATAPWSVGRTPNRRERLVHAGGADLPVRRQNLPRLSREGRRRKAASKTYRAPRVARRAPTGRCVMRGRGNAPDLAVDRGAIRVCIPHRQPTDHVAADVARRRILAQRAAEGWRWFGPVGSVGGAQYGKSRIGRGHRRMQ